MPLIAPLAIALLGAPPDVSFNRDIRPILSDRCWRCHGPDSAARKAGLRLDSFEAATGARPDGRPILPGDPDASLVMQRIGATDPDERMPPVALDMPITVAERALLETWIRGGAEWEPHWSFQPPRRAPVPPDAEHPIDAFIRARLASEGLQPSPPADDATLVRRLFLDLTGLPPTPERVDDYLADARPDRWERLVDELLETPAHAEHMARAWLDVARYGDTHGLHLDNRRSMWPWRDWVIDAYAANMPFDRFVLEQIAGDLLPDATPDQRIATGFNRNNVTTSEGGAIAEEYRVKYAVDRVNTMSTVFLGLTVECAQCHDHKFDPITQNEYYELFAFYGNTADPGMDGNRPDTPPVVRVMDDEQSGRLAELEEHIAELDAALAAPIDDSDPERDAWIAAWRTGAPERWLPLDPTAFRTSGGSTLRPLGDGSLLAEGQNPDRDVYTITARTDATDLRAVRIEALTHDTLPSGGPGRADNANLVLSEVAVEAISVADPEQHRRLDLVAAVADHEQQNGPYLAAHAIDGNLDPGNGWAVEGYARHEDRELVVLAREPFGYAGGTDIVVTLRFETHFARHAIGRVRLSATADERLTGVIVPAARLDAGPELFAVAHLIEADTRTPEDEQRIRRFHYRTTSPEFRQRDDERRDAQAERDALVAGAPTTLVMADRDEPRPTYRLERGEYDRPVGEPLVPDVPSCLPPLPPDAPRDRLGLARWLVHPDHPLTARVTVNRLWQGLFGAGLVRTAGDFGAQGAWPTHPDLLDWLAVEFIESGWDVRHMLRRMVTSATYRQTSRVAPELARVDPENRLLARGPRFRLDAEVIRDQALAASGLLVRTVGGPSVRPAQPPGLWKAVGYPDSDTAEFKMDSGSALFRRSMYTFWKRTSPPPNLAAFDAPSRENCTVRRPRTNTPLQALVLLNDPQFVEMSRHLAERALREGGDDDRARVERAFRLVLARHPRPAEVDVLVRLLEQQRTAYRAAPEDAAALLEVGTAPGDDALDPVEVAAMTNVAGSIIALDEAVTKG